MIDLVRDSIKGICEKLFSIAKTKDSDGFSHCSADLHYHHDQVKQNYFTIMKLK